MVTLWFINKRDCVIKGFSILYLISTFRMSSEAHFQLKGFYINDDAIQSIDFYH